MAYYSDQERIAARMKSYVGPAVIVFVLYWLLFFPGLIANCAYYMEAHRMQRIAGERLPGVSLLFFMLVMAFTLLFATIIIVGFLVTFWYSASA